jgi:transposase-like protein
VHKIGVIEKPYYRWRKEYGNMDTQQAKRLRELEKENERLKKLAAEMSLDNSILKDVIYYFAHRNTVCTMT